MARIAGITIEKNAHGTPRYVRIDLRKHPDFISKLEEIGALKTDEFEEKWKNGMTGKELVEKVKEHLQSKYGNNL